MPLPQEPFPRWQDGPEAEWMRAWRTARRTVVLASEDPQVWPVLAAHYEKRAIRFRFWGGSTPGEVREVTPEVLFTIEGFRSVWFEAWCPLRRARRTFNCNAVELIPQGVDARALPSHPAGCLP